MKIKHKVEIANTAQGKAQCFILCIAHCRAMLQVLVMNFAWEDQWKKCALLTLYS